MRKVIFTLIKGYYGLIKAYYEFIVPNLFIVDTYLPYLPVLFERV